MAIALNTAVDGGNNGGTTNSLTFSKTCAVSSTGLLIVALVGDDTTLDDITSVTYNGVAMTLLLKTLTGQRKAYLYYLLSPASGAHNVVINCTANHWLIAGAADYTGVKQTGQPDASTSQVSGAAASTQTTSITTVADNSWALLMEQGFNASIPPSASTGATRRTFDAAFGAWGLFDSNAAITPAGSYSMTTTRTTVTNKISHIIGSFAPDTGGAATFQPAWAANSTVTMSSGARAA